MFTGCKSQPNEEVYVSDFYNIHEEYKDAWGNVGKYDISLPYIHCDSKSAKKLNQTIKNEYKDLVDSLDEAKEEGYTLPYTKVSYDVYTHSNLLSLVIKEEVETEYPRYKVYHFDVQFSGSDYEHDAYWIAQKEFLEEHGSTMVFFPYTQSTSSTKLKKAINAKIKEYGLYEE